MKRYISLRAALHLILMCVLLNSYMLVKLSLYSLIAIIPIFLLLNVLDGAPPIKTKSFRLKICHHGTSALVTFFGALIPSLVWHAILLFTALPDYTDALHSAIWCILLCAILFWNGIICIYCTSGQMGIRWRVLGAL